MATPLTYLNLIRIFFVCLFSSAVDDDDDDDIEYIPGRLVFTLNHPKAIASQQQGAQSTEANAVGVDIHIYLYIYVLFVVLTFGRYLQPIYCTPVFIIATTRHISSSSSARENV